MGETKPWGCNPRPQCVHKRALLDTVLEEMLDMGAVQPSQSSWEFPVVLAPKKVSVDHLVVGAQGFSPRWIVAGVFSRSRWHQMMSKKRRSLVAGVTI